MSPSPPIEMESCPRCGAPCTEPGLCLRCAAADLADAVLPPAAAPASIPFPDIPGCEVLRLLSTGGMGELWLARHHADGALLAVKLPNAAALAQPGAADRFESEAEILAALDHPNISSLRDTGTAGDGRLYIATEFVDGSDLRRLLRAERLTHARALDIFCKVCAAMEHAHGRNVVHRDLKPGNILVAADGAVKVADFGLAKDTGVSTADARTSAGDGLGTPYYMAPEALRDAAGAGVRADVYSLGVLLYEMLAGSVPMGSFTPLSRRCGLRREWDAVITAALKDDPALRTDSVRKLRESVQRLEAMEQRRSHWRTWRRAGSAAAVLLAAGGAIAWFVLPEKTAARPSFPAPSTATREAPWRNSLGMKFIPLPRHPGVLMAVHETTIAAYDEFFRAEQKPRPAVMERSAGQRLPENGQMEILSARGWVRAPKCNFRDPGFAVTPRHPATGVQGVRAQAFCTWLTLRERQEGRLRDGQYYRLPTLMEWHHAAILPGIDPLLTRGNFAGKEARDNDWPRLRPTGEESDEFPRTAPVDALPPNTLGFHHIAGNVTEWVVPPPVVADADMEADFMAVGGSWSTLATEWFINHGLNPTGHRNRSADTGFRCVLELGSE